MPHAAAPFSFAAFRACRVTAIIVEGVPARAARRRELGTLRALTIQPATEKRYRRQVSGFLAWTATMCGASGDTDELDDQLMCYIECLWSEGEPKQFALDLIAGGRAFPAVRPAVALRLVAVGVSLGPSRVSSASAALPALNPP